MSLRSLLTSPYHTNFFDKEVLPLINNGQYQEANKKFYNTYGQHLENTEFVRHPDGIITLIALHLEYAKHRLENKRWWQSSKVIEDDALTHIKKASELLRVNYELLKLNYAKIFNEFLPFVTLIDDSYISLLIHIRFLVELLPENTYAEITRKVHAYYLACIPGEYMLESPGENEKDKKQDTTIRADLDLIRQKINVLKQHPIVLEEVENVKSFLLAVNTQADLDDIYKRINILRSVYKYDNSLLIQAYHYKAAKFQLAKSNTEKAVEHLKSTLLNIQSQGLDLTAFLKDFKTIYDRLPIDAKKSFISPKNVFLNITKLINDIPDAEKEKKLECLTIIGELLPAKQLKPIRKSIGKLIGSDTANHLTPEQKQLRTRCHFVMAEDLLANLSLFRLTNKKDKQINTHLKLALQTTTQDNAPSTINRLAQLEQKYFGYKTDMIFLSLLGERERVAGLLPQETYTQILHKMHFLSLRSREHDALTMPCKFSVSEAVQKSQIEVDKLNKLAVKKSLENALQSYLSNDSNQPINESLDKILKEVPLRIKDSPEVTQTVKSILDMIEDDSLKASIRYLPTSLKPVQNDSSWNWSFFRRAIGNGITSLGSCLGLGSSPSNRS